MSFMTLDFLFFVGRSSHDALKTRSGRCSNRFFHFTHLKGLQSNMQGFFNGPFISGCCIFVWRCCFFPKQLTVGVLNATLDLAALVLVGVVGFLGSEVVLSPVVSHCLRSSPFMWGVGVGWCGRLLGL